MPQRPAGISRVQRPQTPPAVPPERPTAPRNGLSWTGRAGWNGYAKALENHPAANTPAPTGGEGVPNTPAGPFCRMCQAYPADLAWHEQWHINLDKWARGVNDELAAMRRFLQQLGYVPTTENTTTTDGNTDDA